jgi:hypothetical protein
MSETVSVAVPEAAAPIPGFLATPKTGLVNGQSEAWMVVRYGAGADPQHVLEVRRVDMGDQFDLAEVAGAQVDNDVWLSLAIVALSVQSIDGAPQPRGNTTKASLRNTLKTIGPLGVRAVRRALYEMSGVTADAPAGDQERAAAGN